MSANAEIIAELRRVLNERDEARRERDEWRDKFHALNQTAGELCNACGWAFKIPGEPCRCEVVKERDEARAEVEKLSESAKAAWEAECVMREQRDRYHAEWKQERQEVERLRMMLPVHPSSLTDACTDAYRRGAEAMRARCEETARHACSVIGKLEHTYGIMTQGHIETVSRLILEADIPEEP